MPVNNLQPGFDQGPYRRLLNEVIDKALTMQEEILLCSFSTEDAIQGEISDIFQLADTFLDQAQLESIFVKVRAIQSVIATELRRQNWKTTALKSSPREEEDVHRLRKPKEQLAMSRQLSVASDQTLHADIVKPEETADSILAEAGIVAAEPYSYKDEAEIALKFINHAAMYTYDEQQPGRFKSLVTKDNPHLALLASVTRLPSKLTRALSMQLCTIAEHLNGDKKLIPCQMCFRPQKNIERHIEKCMKLKMKRKFLVLSLDGRTYFCQFGCHVRSTNLQTIYLHLVREHSFEELREWGINRDFLIDECGAIHEKKQMSNVQYQVLSERVRQNAATMAKQAEEDRTRRIIQSGAIAQKPHQTFGECMGPFSIHRDYQMTNPTFGGVKFDHQDLAQTTSPYQAAVVSETQEGDQKKRRKKKNGILKSLGLKLQDNDHCQVDGSNKGQAEEESLPFVIHQKRKPGRPPLHRQETGKSEKTQAQKLSSFGFGTSGGTGEKASNCSTQEMTPSLPLQPMSTPASATATENSLRDQMTALLTEAADEYDDELDETQTESASTPFSTPSITTGQHQQHFFGQPWYLNMPFQGSLGDP